MAGAAFIRSVRSFVPTSTGTQDFTIAGIGTPKGVMIFLSNAVTDETSSLAARMCIGFSDGTNHGGIGISSQSAVADSNTSRSMSDTHLVSMPAPSGASMAVEAAFDSWITDGVRINWTTVDTVTHRVTVVFICGDDAHVKVGQYDMPDNTGTPNQTLDVTGCGFNPDTLFVLSIVGISGFSGGGTAFAAGSAMSLGMACYNGVVNKTRCLAYSHRDARVSGQPSTYTNDSVVLSTGFAGAASGALAKIGPTELDSFITDGFRVKDAVGADPPLCLYMAVLLDGVSVDITGINTPTSPGTSTILVPHGGSCFVISTSADAIGDKTDSQATGFGWGIATQHEQFSIAQYEEDNVATINNGSFASGDSVIYTPTEAGAVGLEAQVSIPGSFSFDFITVYGTARKVFVLHMSKPTFGGSGTMNAGNPDLDGVAVLAFQGSGNVQGGTGDIDAAGLTVATIVGSGNIQGGNPDIDAAATLAFQGAGDLEAGNPDIAASGDLVFQGTAALQAGSPSIASLGNLAFTAAGDLSAGSPDVAALGLLVFTGAAALQAGTPALSGAGFTGFTATGDLQAGSPAIDATGQLVFQGSANLLAGAPDAQGVGAIGFQGAGDLEAGSPDAEGAGQLVFLGAGALLAGSPDLDGSGTLTGLAHIGTGNLIGPSGLIGAAVLLVFRGSSDLIGPSGFISATNAPAIGCEHDMTGSHDLSAELFGSHDLNGELLGSHNLVANLLGSHDVSADLSGSYDAQADLRGSNC